MSPTATTVDARPATVNLIAYSGDSWSLTFRFLADTVPIDLTGLTVEAEARSTLGADTALVVTVTDALDGTVQVQPPVEGLPADVYRYDIEATDAGAVTTWVRGHLRIEQDITA